MLRVDDIEKYFGSKLLFSEFSLSIECGEKLALLGPNGSGKSTLLKIIAGILKADSGKLSYFTSPKISYLAQEFCSQEAINCAEYLAGEFFKAASIVKHLENSVSESPDDPELLASYLNALEKFEDCGAYAFEAKLDELLEGLGLGNDSLNLSTPIAHLSGGQKSRLALARVLIDDADLLLLDEPTNFLDRQALEWLETALSKKRAACIIVSHDRRFLDKLCTRTLEIDTTSSRIFDYSGNYSFYKQYKEAEEARQWREYNIQQRKLKRLTEDIRQVKEQASNTENRTVNDYIRGRAKKVAAKAKARETRLNHMLEKEKIEKPVGRGPGMRIDLAGCKLYDSCLISAENLCFSFDAGGGNLFFESLNLELKGSARIVLSGNNGSGKSTLLDLLLGLKTPLSGKLYRKEGLSFCFLPQMLGQNNEETTVLEFLSEMLKNASDPKLNDRELRGLLHRFEFARDDSHKQLRFLSMGERVKLNFAAFMALKPDLLVLDEPTSHLDLQAIEKLEEALCNYKGAFIVVSHDRYFIDAIEATYQWRILEENTGARRVEVYERSMI